MKQKIIYIILGLSIILNVLYIKYDTIDFIWPKIEKEYFQPSLIDTTDFLKAEKRIVESSLKMLSSNESIMVWDESYGLANKVVGLKYMSNQDEFRRFNYPRAFLFYGLTKYLLKSKDSISMNILMEEFDKYITSEGKPNFTFDKVDQIVFGLTAIELYKYTDNDKYFNFIRFVYLFMLESKDHQDVINYRLKHDNYLNDVLGMVIPYMVERKNLDLAERQLTYFIEYGVNKKTHLPTHGFNRLTFQETGSSNWGRGIGWYYLALAFYHNVTDDFKDRYVGITNSINNMRCERGLWSQFPGSSNEFDASTSTLFLYGQTLLNPELHSKRDIISMFSNYINEDGEILQTSGDTYGLNWYSKRFGKSELSQGILLLLLTNALE